MCLFTIHLLGGKGINLDVWFDPNLPHKNERCHLVASPYNYLTSYTRFVTTYFNSFDLACFQWTSQTPLQIQHLVNKVIRKDFVIGHQISQLGHNEGSSQNWGCKFMLDKKTNNQAQISIKGVCHPISHSFVCESCVNLYNTS